MLILFSQDFFQFIKHKVSLSYHHTPNNTPNTAQPARGYLISLHLVHLWKECGLILPRTRQVDTSAPLITSRYFARFCIDC